MVVDSIEVLAAVDTGLSLWVVDQRGSAVVEALSDVVGEEGIIAPKAAVVIILDLKADIALETGRRVQAPQAVLRAPDEHLI